MSTSSKDVLYLVNHVKYKNSDGALYVMAERLAWIMNGRDTFSISHKFSDIKMQKISPDEKSKIQLQVLLLDGGASTFHFTSPEGAEKQIKNRDTVKKYLFDLLPRFKIKVNKELEEKIADKLSENSTENLSKNSTESLLGNEIGKIPEKQFPTAKSVSTPPEIQPCETQVYVPRSTDAMTTLEVFKNNPDVFRNIGNSGYMNATIQALMSLPDLIHLLGSDKYSNIQNGLLRAFLRLNNVRFDNSNVIKTGYLSAFKEKMIKTSNKFNDPKRFEDANQYYLSFKESIKREIKQILPYDRSIDDLMTFEIVDNTCTSPQTYSELGIDIPNEMNFGAKFELNSLIKSAFQCPFRQSGDLIKRFSRIPEILVVHLCRNWQKGKSSGKNSSEINVLEQLNLKRFCTDSVSDGCEYQLAAVIERLGCSATCGPYIARVCHEEKWLKCHDLYVTEMEEQIADSCARTWKLLFYGRIN